MREFYKGTILFLVFMALLPLPRVYAQLGYDDEICLEKSPKQLKQEEQKRKLLNGLNKTLIYFSYLSYSDRTKERNLTGREEFEKYEGWIIRNVEVQVLKPFGVSIENPEQGQSTRFQQFANKSQIKTRDWVVRNELLFKEGDYVDPLLVADTERNLWEGRNFKDVKIFLQPVNSHTNLVDVIVMVQDRWSWNIVTSVQYNKATAGIQFKNFLGIPQSLSNYVSLNYRKDNFYTVHGNYQYNNIKKSQISFRVGYEYSNLNKGGNIEIRRNFFSSQAKWAGHIKAGIYREGASVPNDLGEAIPTNTFNNRQDVWLATALKFPGVLGKKYPLQRVIISGRMYRKQYMMRPYRRSPDGSQSFINNTYFLGSIGFAQWDYYVDQSVYYLGGSEYFTKGLSGAIILGFDDDEELKKRFYSGLQLSLGKYLGKGGYFNTTASYGGFTKRNSYQQILLKWSSRFYSAPIKLGNKFMMRQFVSASVALGFNRPIGRELVVNNNNGVRGIYVDYIRGDRNYVFNFETDIYPTFKVLGFSSSVFAFADIAVSQSGSIKNYKLTQGYGAGLRLRNLGLGIDYFEITFAYYPGLAIPNHKPYAIIGGFENQRAIPQENLFVPDILKVY